jgi:hypothetical protein
VTNKDKELEQYRIQLKNLKRSRSSDTYERNNRRQVVENSNAVLTGKSNSSTSIEQSSSSSGNNTSSSSSSNSSSDTVPATIVEGDVAHHNVVVEKKKEGKMSASSDSNLPQPSDMTLSRQLDCANDEIKLLRNKIARLEDDLLSATQVGISRSEYILRFNNRSQQNLYAFGVLAQEPSLYFLQCLVVN